MTQKCASGSSGGIRNSTVGPRTSHTLRDVPSTRRSKVMLLSPAICVYPSLFLHIGLNRCDARFIHSFLHVGVNRCDALSIFRGRTGCPSTRLAGVMGVGRTTA